MNFFYADSFNQLYYQLLESAYYQNISLSESRVGNVKDLGKTVYQISNDTFRLCFLQERNFNPFFAFTEASWILEGLNSVEPLQHYIKTYDQFSDDGSTLNGAYGYRLKSYFHINQIKEAIDLLKKDAHSRRVVLTMYSPDDLQKDSKDIPCNTTIYLKIKNNKLDMTILNRSNDLYLGVPYNVFVFFILQCYIASQLKCELGIQTHYTDSLHLYERDFDKVKCILDSNSLQSISGIEKQLSFDNSQYASINHTKIISRQFFDLADSAYKKIFLEYNLSAKEKEGLVQNPENLLQYCVYNWLNRKSKNKEGKRVKSNIEILDSLKYQSIDVMKSELQRISQENLTNIDKIKELICTKIISENSLMNFDLSKTDQIIPICILSIVKDTINAFNVIERELVMSNIKSICEEENINMNDITYFVGYTEELRAIIN
ncbi:MAG: thymidylate synthase [Spirochaetia bacterium]|nr:thymidylate synthase [Spirochaetia bacterium]